MYSSSLRQERSARGAKMNLQFLGRKCTVAKPIATHLIVATSVQVFGE